jgi:hypothetical protein
MKGLHAMNSSQSVRFPSIRAVIGSALLSGLMLATSSASARDLSKHEAAIVHMAADPKTAETVLRESKTPTEKLDYALFLHAYRPHDKANLTRISDLLADLKTAIEAKGEYWGKDMIGELLPYDGSDASLIPIIRATSTTDAGNTKDASYAIPCGVLQKRPGLLEATEALYGSSGDAFVPSSGCISDRGAIAGFPDKTVDAYLALAGRAEGCIGCGGGTIRFALWTQEATQHERMRLDPRYFLNPKNNISDPKQAYPYQAWSYLTLSNRRVGARIEPRYNHARIALTRYYRSLGLKPDQAMQAATRALFGAPFGAHCGELAVTPSLRTLVMEGADADTIQRFIDSGAWRTPSHQAIAACGARAGMDPMAHVALRDPRILAMLSQLAAGLSAEDRKRLDLEMDVDQPNAFRKTPLMTAAQFGLKDSANWLISHGANVNAATDDTEMHNNGRTALHYAAASGSLPLIRLLVTHGASIDARDTVGGEAEYLGVKDTPGNQTPRDYLIGAGPGDAPKLSGKDTVEAMRLLTGKS